MFNFRKNVLFLFLSYFSQKESSESVPAKALRSSKALYFLAIYSKDKHDALNVLSIHSLPVHAIPFDFPTSFSKVVQFFFVPLDLKPWTI